MSTTVNRQEFVSALRALSAVGSTSLIPVLSNVLLDGKDGILTITANNLEMQARRRIPYSGDPIYTTAPAKKITDFANNFTGDDLDLSVDAGKLRLSSGKRKASAPIIDPDEFPTWKLEGEPTASFAIQHDQLARGVQRVQHAVSDGKGGRVILTAIHIKSQGDGTLLFESADNYRLARATEDVQADAFEVNATAASLKAVGRILPEDEIRVTITPRGISFESEGAELLSRMIEGQYPNTDPVFPTQFPTTVTVSLDALESAVKLAGIANENVLDLSLVDGALVVKAALQGEGDSEDTIEASVQGESELTVRLRPKYVTDTLAALGDSTSVEIGYNSATAPIRMKAPDDESFATVLMPIRTN